MTSTKGASGDASARLIERIRQGDDEAVAELFDDAFKLRQYRGLSKFRAATLDHVWPLACANACTAIRTGQQHHDLDGWFHRLFRNAALAEIERASIYASLPEESPNAEAAPKRRLLGMSPGLAHKALGGLAASVVAALVGAGVSHFMPDTPEVVAKIPLSPQPAATASAPAATTPPPAAGSIRDVAPVVTSAPRLSGVARPTPTISRSPVPSASPISHRYSKAPDLSGNWTITFTPTNFAGSAASYRLALTPSDGCACYTGQWSGSTDSTYPGTAFVATLAIDGSRLVFGATDSRADAPGERTYAGRAPNDDRELPLAFPDGTWSWRVSKDEVRTASFSLVRDAP